jgi:hypothetical protein
VPPELVHVQLQTRDEHDVEQTNGAEELHRAVLLQDVQGVGTHDDTRDDEADDTRHLELP